MIFKEKNKINTVFKSFPQVVENFVEKFLNIATEKEKKCFYHNTKKEKYFFKSLEFTRKKGKNVRFLNPNEQAVWKRLCKTQKNNFCPVNKTGKMIFFDTVFEK